MHQQACFQAIDRVCKDTRSDGFMGSQELIDVVFQNQFGMYFGPVVRCTDKRKKKFDVFQCLSIEDTFEGTERSRRIRSFQEDMRCTSKDRIFLSAVRLQGQRHCTHSFTQSKLLIQVGFERKIT